MQYRSIPKCSNQLLEEDPNTPIKAYAIREMVRTGEIGHIRRGRNIYIDYDELKEYLSTTAKKKGLYGRVGNTYLMARLEH